MEILYKLLVCFTMMVCISQVAMILGSIANRNLNFPFLTSSVPFYYVPDLVLGGFLI